jgi:hypothetical protein
VHPKMPCKFKENYSIATTMGNICMMVGLWKFQRSDPKGPKSQDAFFTILILHPIIANLSINDNLHYKQFFDLETSIFFLLCCIS